MWHPCEDKQDNKGQTWKQTIKIQYVTSPMKEISLQERIKEEKGIFLEPTSKSVQF
jgi:hypothetical protein